MDTRCTASGCVHAILNGFIIIELGVSRSSDVMSSSGMRGGGGCLVFQHLLTKCIAQRRGSCREFLYIPYDMREMQFLETYPDPKFELAKG